MSIALMLIDIQNDYFPNGKMELSNPMKAANNACRILDWFRAKKYEIYHIQHVSNRSGAGFFLPDTEGVKIHQSVLPLEQENIIVKHAPNSFFNTELRNKLKEKEIKKLVICGMMTHMCIDATVRAARELGLECTVIEDACTTKDLMYRDQLIPAEQVHFAFIGALNGMYATVSTTNEFLTQNAAFLNEA
ncbi:cysteine hydrolase family protein [Ectobacillus polymachus]|uniref:cysteine hydrolase family protein n=1 Tax=Ectobacillus polymachus TaxID=1508806 RepID=UPI003A8744FC